MMCSSVQRIKDPRVARWLAQGNPCGAKTLWDLTHSVHPSFGVQEKGNHTWKVLKMREAHVVDELCTMQLDQEWGLGGALV